MKKMDTRPPQKTLRSKKLVCHVAAYFYVFFFERHSKVENISAIIQSWNSSFICLCYGLLFCWLREYAYFFFIDPYIFMGTFTESCSVAASTVITTSTVFTVPTAYNFYGYCSCLAFFLRLLQLIWLL